MTVRARPPATFSHQCYGQYMIEDIGTYLLSILDIIAKITQTSLTISEPNLLAQMHDNEYIKSIEIP